MTDKENLENRLRDVITNTCNTVGCANCGLKWDGGCTACELEHKLMIIELNEVGNDS